MTREFPKQEFSIEQFKKADAFAYKRGLQLSRDIVSLIEARNPELGAPVQRQTVNIEISSSLNNVMDITFSLNFVPMFKINSNTKLAIKSKKVINVKWEIIF